MKPTNHSNEYLFSGRYSNYVFILLFILYGSVYADRMVVNSMFTFIQKEWGITDTQCGWLVTIIYLATALLSTIVSFLVDRWSRTKAIGIMGIIWSLATALGAITGNFAQLFLARVMIGVGQAGFAPGGNALISGIYPLEKRSKMLGIWNASIPLGSAIGVTIGGIIAQSMGWRSAFGIIAIPGLIAAILFLFVKDYKTVDLSIVDERNNKIKMNKKDILMEFVEKPSALYTYFGISSVVFVTTALIVWLPTYFVQELNMEPKTAGSLAGAVMLPALIGAPLGGFLIDKWRSRQQRARLLFPALSTFISTLLLFVTFFVLKGTSQIPVLLLFGVIIMTFIAGAAAVTQDVIHPGLRATSYSIAVTIQNLLGSAAPVILGRISDVADIKTAMKILPFVLMAGAILFYLGSKYYINDLGKVPKVKLEIA